MTWFLTLISGLLLGLSLPPNPFGMLEWIAFVPLFIAARRSGAIKAFHLGILSVFTSSLLIIVPMRTPEELGNAGGGCALLALLIGWTCAFAAAMRTESPWKWAVGVAAAGVAGEWMTHGLFPLYAAMGQWRNPSIMPVAAGAGIWGISFLIYALNAILAVAGDRLLPLGKNPLARTPSPQAFRHAAGAVALLAGIHLFGWGYNAREIAGKRLKVAAMQPGMGGDYLPLLHRAKAAGAEIVVWPELALSEPLEKDLEKHRVPGLTQVIGYKGAPPDEGLPQNYAALVGPDGQITARYRKIHLFGSERFVHQPGRELVVADGPAGKAGLAICYDTMFTEVARGLVRRGAQILYVPNMDPGANRGALHALHAAVTVFRSAENGVPQVRSEWTGYSMIVDGRGRILADAGMVSPSVPVAEVTLPDRPGTLYTRTGEVLPPLCLLLLVGLIFWEGREERRRKDAREREIREFLLEEPGPAGSIPGD
jgi:deaminated glutathione amidase